MIRAAVFSDTHANTARMVRTVRSYRPDIVLHLGDHARDTDILRREFPDIPVFSVCGNCDFGDSAPETLVVPLGPVRLFLAHGHQYNVRWTLDYLVYAAQEAGAKGALFGHTHEAANVEIGGVQVVNPGTAGKGLTLSWASLTVFDNGGVACEIHEL